MFYWVIHQVSIKFKYLLTLCHNISIHQINIHLQINQAIQMFKCIFVDALGKIIATQMTINIKEDYIVFFHYRVLFYRICTYKKVISFSTSYGNWSRPWPVQFILTSWHWQPDAISEHMKSEIHCHDEFNIFTIQFYRNLTTVIVFVVPSQITIQLPVAHHRLMNTRPPMTFEFIFSTFRID